MILAVTILFFPLVYADYRSWCGNGSETEIDLIKSEDGIPGRYIVQWCSHGDRNITQWNIELRYLKDNRSPENCVDYDVYNVHPHADLHSRVEEPINLNFSCPILCMAKTLDLLFSSCYTLKSRVKYNNLSQHNDTMHYVHNNMTLALYKHTTTYLDKKSNDERLVLTWYSGYIPITEYVVLLYMFNDTLAEGERSLDVSHSCSLTSWHEVRCALTAAPGRYRASLQHAAPWSHAALVPSLYQWSFNHSTEPATVATVPSPALAGWAALAGCAGGALAAGVGGAALLALLVRRRRARLRREWQAMREADHKPLAASEEKPSPPDGDIKSSGEILLLYAREAPAQQAAKALKQLLTEVGAEVVDVHGITAMARWAAAPAQKTRAALADPNTRIVLILSPEMRLAQENSVYTPPGLPPQFGDELLQYALRTLATAPPGRPYKKLFVVTLPGQPSPPSQPPGHSLAHLVPFTRFPLPAAITPLLQHLRLTSEHELLQRFQQNFSRVPNGC